MNECVKVRINSIQFNPSHRNGKISTPLLLGATLFQSRTFDFVQQNHYFIIILILVQEEFFSNNKILFTNYLFLHRENLMKFSARIVFCHLSIL